MGNSWEGNQDYTFKSTPSPVSGLVVDSLSFGTCLRSETVETGRCHDQGRPPFHAAIFQASFMHYHIRVCLFQGTPKQLRVPAFKTTKKGCQLQIKTILNVCASLAGFKFTPSRNHVSALKGCLNASWVALIRHVFQESIHASSDDCMLLPMSVRNLRVHVYVVRHIDL